MAFIEETDDTPCYGFVDPLLILRLVHLMPAFEYDVQEKKLSKLNPLFTGNGTVKEYVAYYVNWYVSNF